MTGEASRTETSRSPARVGRPRRRAGISALAALASLLLIALAGVPAASAAPDKLWDVCKGGSPDQEIEGDISCANPRGIAVNGENGRIYLAEQQGQRVNVFNPLGTFLRTWGWDVVASGPGNMGTGFEICVPADGDTCKAGVSGTGGGQFRNPAGMALDSTGDVYVTDFTNGRVQKFSPDGEFILMFGGEVNQTKVEEAALEAQQNRCPVDPGDVCKAGVQGTGNGQFGSWRATDVIAATPDDRIFVGDEGRVQRFNTAGAYQDECAVPGGETIESLDVDASARLYAAYNGVEDARRLGYAGGGECEEQLTYEVPKYGLEFETLRIPESIAVDTAGHVYVSCCPNRRSGMPFLVDPIIEFDAAGNVVDEWGKEEFSTNTHHLATNLCPGSEAPGNLFVTDLDLDFLRAYGTPPFGCFKARTLPASEIEETAARLNGMVDPDGELSANCRFEYGTDESYGSEAPCDKSPAEIGEGTDPVAVSAELAGLVKGTVYHFRLSAEVGGEGQNGADETFKTLGPPVISDEHVAGATDTDASLKAKVNPEGFTTTYQVEYGLSAGYGQSTAPVQIGGAGDRKEHAIAPILEGLEPNRTYHWRVVAENSSGQAESADHTLTTFPPFAPGKGCPNEAFRTAASSFLPDCRAYEMVSPVDKNGGDVLSFLTISGPGGYIQARPDGGKITYTASTAFAGQPSSLQANQYIATRGGGSWSNEGINRPLPGDPADAASFGLVRDYQGFSEDLCTGWLIDNQTPPLPLDGQAGIRNLLERDNCDPDPSAYGPPGYGAYEPLIPAPPELDPGTSLEYVIQDSVGGVSADLRHVLFSASTPLGEDAAPGFSPQVYDNFEGKSHVVSVLPSGAASTDGNAVGSGGARNLKGAVSEDGSVVYWNAGGRLYVRTNPEQPQSALEGGSATGTGSMLEGLNLVLEVSTTSGAFVAGQRITGHGIPPGTRIAAVGAGTLTLSASATSTVVGTALEAFGDCTEPVKACTLPASIGGGFFWQGATDGSKALFGQGPTGSENLFTYDLAADQAGETARRLVAGEVIGVAGASDDLSRIYFASREALAAGASAGEPNLYLEDEGTVSFIATLAEGDVGAKEPGGSSIAYSVVGEVPRQRAARVTPDGEQIAFQSRAQLTEYDNTAAGSGKPAVEVYRFEAGSDLTCVSCNPSGARPHASLMPISFQYPWLNDQATQVAAAAWIPTWEHPLHASRVLSADGNRVFFNSNDALVPRDANGTQDVYQWEAPGTDGCSAESPSFFPSRDGCIDLISSGQSSFESRFWEASANGDDVFFITQSSLLPQDPGSIDLYDARVGGGHPQAAEKSACEGEACQSPPGAPDFGTPASGIYTGPPNPLPGRSCAPAARRALVLSKRAKRAQRASKRAWRAGRRDRAKQMRGKARRFARGARRQSQSAKRCRRANRRGAVK